MSAKYKGAFCEAKIKKCNKTVKCKVRRSYVTMYIGLIKEDIQTESSNLDNVTLKYTKTIKRADNSPKCVFSVLLIITKIQTGKLTQISSHFTEILSSCSQHHDFMWAEPKWGVDYAYTQSSWYWTLRKFVPLIYVPQGLVLLIGVTIMKNTNISLSVSKGISLDVYCILIGVPSVHSG